MRIAIYTGTFIKNQDGVARSLYRLVDTMLKKGIKVLVISPQITPQNRKGLVFCKVPSIPLVLYPDYKVSIPNGRVIRALKAFSPDLIHISTPDFLALQLIQWGKMQKIPLVSIHHTDFPNYLSYFHLGFAKEMAWDVYTRVYNLTERTFAPTDEYRRILNHRGVKHADVWTRGIDREKFHPRHRSEKLRHSWKVDNKKVILYAGRFVWYKNLKMILKVYQKFEHRLDNDVAFVLVGSGPAESTLRKKMPKAIFTGYLHNSDLSKAFASADIFLFPSKTETFGQVVQEAISSGLPAVVSNVGGCQEIVKNSKAGFVIDGDDVNAYYNALEKLIDQPDLYSKLQQRGQKYTAHQTWDKINSRIIRKYKIIALNLKKFRKIQLDQLQPAPMGIIKKWMRVK